MHWHTVYLVDPHADIPAPTMSFHSFAGFLTQLIGFAAPAYFSMKALESPQPQDDVQWLTYWVVFGAFTFAETFVNV